MPRSRIVGGVMVQEQAPMVIGGFGGNAAAVAKIFGDLAYGPPAARRALIVPGQIITNDMLNNNRVDQIDVDNVVNFLLRATTTQDINVQLTDGRVVLVRAGTYITRRNNEDINFILDDANQVDFEQQAGGRRRKTRRNRRSTRRTRYRR
jgi:hypothetical protein